MVERGLDEEFRPDDGVLLELARLMCDLSRARTMRATTTTRRARVIECASPVRVRREPQGEDVFESEALIGEHALCCRRGKARIARRRRRRAHGFEVDVAAVGCVAARSGRAPARANGVKSSRIAWSSSRRWRIAARVSDAEPTPVRVEPAGARGTLVRLSRNMDLRQRRGCARRRLADLHNNKLEFMRR